MKKILIMLSLLASVQLFSANYEVIQSNLTQQEINKNNVQIEKAAQRDYGRALTEISKKAMKGGIDYISEMVLSTLEIENEDLEREIDLEIKKVFNKIFDLLESKREFEIIKIRYIASNVVEVIVKLKEPDTYKIFSSSSFFENSIIEKISMLEEKNLSEEDTRKEFVKILFNNKKQLKDVTEVEIYKKMAELMMNELTVKVEKLLKEEENYDEDEVSFYLEKNGDKWEIPELEEKIKTIEEILTLWCITEMGNTTTWRKNKKVARDWFLKIKSQKSIIYFFYLKNTMYI